MGDKKSFKKRDVLQSKKGILLFLPYLCWAVIYLREIHFSDVKINISGLSLLKSIHYEYGEHGCKRQGCQEEEWPWHGEEAQVKDAPLKVGVIFFFFLGLFA